jgi:hypothetical protein
MLIPLYGFLRGDVMGLLVLVHDHDTVADLAASLQQAAAARVAPCPRAQVYLRGRLLDPAISVAQAGLTALDRVDVVGGEGAP